MIFIPEGLNGRGWSKFGSEVGKVREFFKGSARPGVVRTSPSSVKLSPVSTVAASGSPGCVGAPSYADVLRKGISRTEKEIRPHLSAIPRGRMHGLRPKSEKEGLRSAPLLDKAPHDRCGGDKRLKSLFPSDVHLTRDKDMMSSLLHWRRQLEELKADVERALSRVSEGLIVCGPGYKPDPKSKSSRRKNKKGRNKSKRSLRWVQKQSTQNSSLSIGAPAESVHTGLARLHVSSALERCTGFVETNDGSSSQTNQDAVGSLEAGEVPSEKEVAPLPACPDIRRWSSFLL